MASQEHIENVATFLATTSRTYFMTQNLIDTLEALTNSATVEPTVDDLTEIGIESIQWGIDNWKEFVPQAMVIAGILDVPVRDLTDIDPKYKI